MNKRMMAACAAALIGFSALGATWTGGGDGTSWGDSRNWGGALPSTSEAVTISTGGNDLTIDIGDVNRVVGKMTVKNGGKLTFTGNASLQTCEVNANSSSATVFNVPVVFGGADATYFVVNNASVNFNSPVSVADEGESLKTLRFESTAPVNVNSTFTGPNTSVRWKMGGAGSTDYPMLDFKAKVIAAKLVSLGAYTTGWCCLRASGNEIGYASIAYTSLLLDAKDALSDQTYLTWGTYYSENNDLYGSYDFRGRDQVINRVDNTTTRAENDECRYLLSRTGNMTLTMKGSQDASANCYVNQGVSLVWDPTGDYTQEFTLKHSTTAGGITVKRGTFKVSGTATFANLSSIAVAGGATFDLASTESGALANLKTLTVGPQGKVKVASTSATPFSGRKLAAEIDEGGVINTSSDLVISNLFYAGRNVRAGTYRSSTSAAEATEAEWVVGSGVVTVLTGDGRSKADRYWTGGGDGESWNVAANWEPKGVPADQDSVFFTNSVTIIDGVALDADRPFDVAANCSVVLSGVVSGAGDLQKTGSGSLSLRGDNTFTGSLKIDKGAVCAYGENALGDNASGTVEVRKENEPTPYNLLLSGTTVRKALVVRNVDDGSNSSQPQVKCAASTTNVLLGQVSAPAACFRVNVDTKAQLVIAGGASFSSFVDFIPQAGSEIVIRETPISFSIYDAPYAGRIVFACTGNVVTRYGSARDRGVRESWKTDVNGAFSVGSLFNFGGANAVIDLAGTTQTVNRIEAIVNAGTGEPIASGTVTSATDAQIAFASDSVYTNSAVYAGRVSLKKQGSGTVFLTAACTSTGDLIVDSGTAVLAAGAKWAGTIRLCGGELKLADKGALDSRSVIVFNGGALNLPAGEYVLGGAVDANGDPLAPGRYSSTELPSITGEGAVTVLPTAGAEVTYTWTGAGDGKFSSAENWQGTTLPAFGTPGGRYVFPAAEFTATVDVSVFAKSFAFTAADGGTATLVADAGGSVTFCSGSLSVDGANGGTAKSVDINVPIRYADALAVKVGETSDKTTAAQTLKLTGGVASLGAPSFSKCGYGALHFVGDDNSLCGGMVVSNGYLYVKGENPIGGDGALHLPVCADDGDTRLVLAGATVRRDVRFAAASGYSGLMLMSLNAVTNVLAGKVESVGFDNLRVHAGVGTVNVFAGGLVVGGYLVPEFSDGTGYFVVSNVPAAGASRLWFESQGDNKLVLDCAGNRFDGGWSVNNRIETLVDGAIDANQTVTFKLPANKVPGGVLELGETHQTFAGCVRLIETNEVGTVTGVSNGKVVGSTGSRLTLSGSAAVNLPAFDGEVSYENAGSGERRMFFASRSTGDLVVTDGALTLEAPSSFGGKAQSAAVIEGGRWRGRSVLVTGGELRINHANGIAHRSTVSVEGGTVVIPSGVEVSCKKLLVGGEELPCGVYGKADLPGVLTGDGTVRVLGEGLMLFVR